MAKRSLDQPSAMKSYPSVASLRELHSKFPFEIDVGKSGLVSARTQLSIPSIANMIDFGACLLFESSKKYSTT